MPETRFCTCQPRPRLRFHGDQKIIDIYYGLTSLSYNLDHLQPQHIFAEIALKWPKCSLTTDSSFGLSFTPLILFQQHRLHLLEPSRLVESPITKVNATLKSRHRRPAPHQTTDYPQVSQRLSIQPRHSSRASSTSLSPRPLDMQSLLRPLSLHSPPYTGLDVHQKNGACRRSL